MQLTSYLTLVVAAASTATAASDYENSLACARKNVNANAAISAFCNKKGPKGGLINDITVPGQRSSTGVVVGGVRVKLTGDCSPKQWVPLQYCLTQFHAMCAESGDATGLATRQYGRGGCQTWHIEDAHGLAAMHQAK